MPDTDPAAAGAGDRRQAELTAQDLELLGAQPLRRSDPADIGPYRVLARLGGGGMGRLYLARDADVEGAYAAPTLVAVKVIRSEYAEDERFRRRFGREIEAVGRVHGAYTAELLGSGLDQDELLWMANTYVPGLSLADAVLRCGSLPVPVVWRLANEIGQALVAISAAGIVHRDLKPSNVLLGPQGARLIDFGVAHTVDSSALTMTGQQLGTPAFMSPEQADGREVGTASDVFSLGSVLAMAVTGSAPFGEGTTGDVIHRVIYSPPSPQVLAAVAQRDPALAELIGRCLDKDPARRPSPQDVVSATRARPLGEGWPERIAELIGARAGWHGRAVVLPVAEQLTILRRTKPERPAEGPAARRRLPWAVAAAVATAAVAGAAAFMVFAGPGKDDAHARAADSLSAARSSVAASAPAPHGKAKPKPGHTTAHPKKPAAPPTAGGTGGYVPPSAPAGQAPPVTTAPAPPRRTPTTSKPPPMTIAPAPEPWKSCSYYSGTALTVYGDTGSHVKEIQCILRARGYDIGPAGVDGDFGQDTLTVVKAFQRKHGLTVDGQVGTKTWHALRA